MGSRVANNLSKFTSPPECWTIAGLLPFAHLLAKDLHGLQGCLLFSLLLVVVWRKCDDYIKRFDAFLGQIAM